MSKFKIVKPWSKSWSQQAPKSNKSRIKRKKEGFGPWADTKITWATTHPQLLSMKECSGKKVLIVKVAQNDPLDSSSQKNWPGGQRDQGRGVVLHVQEEVYQSTLTFRRRVARYLEWSPLPIQPRRLTRWTVRTRTWGSPTWSRRRLSRTYYF